MLREAQQKLAESSARFKFEVINAQSIPFEQDSFDAVIAILVMGGSSGGFARRLSIGMKTPWW